MPQEKHSAGPWRVDGNQILDANGEIIATVHIEEWENDEVADHEEANARLIAAAPHLLAACLAGLDEFKALGQSLGEMTPVEMVETWNTVEEAVKKAAG